METVLSKKLLKVNNIQPFAKNLLIEASEEQNAMEEETI